MAVPSIPRSEWSSHPHFATQTLLLASHEEFRGRSRWIIDHLRDLAPRGAADARRRRRWLGRMREDFRWWLSGMHLHERYEERKLYPYLADRYGVSFADLTADHRAMTACEERALGSFAAAMEESGQARSLLSMLPLAQLLNQLEEHRGILSIHLEREEDRVIPMLLELPPAEFQRFRRAPRPPPSPTG